MRETRDDVCTNKLSSSLVIYAFGPGLPLVGCFVQCRSLGPSSSNRILVNREAERRILQAGYFYKGKSRLIGVSSRILNGDKLSE